MFKVVVNTNLSQVTNRLEMININLQSSLAEAVSAAESDLRNLFSSEGFKETDISFEPNGDSISISITNPEQDYYKYEGSGDNSVSEIKIKAKEIFAQKIKEKIAGRK